MTKGAGRTEVYFNNNTIDVLLCVQMSGIKSFRSLLSFMAGDLN